MRTAPRRRPIPFVNLDVVPKAAAAAVCAALLLGGGLPNAAYAQAEPDSTGASADSLDVASADSLDVPRPTPTGAPPPSPGFHPKYNTAYAVFKTRRDWTQKLALDQVRGPATLNASLDAGITKDRDQNDLELYTSGSTNRLRYAVGEGLDVGVLADFDRSKRLSRTSDLRSTTDVFRLTSGLRETFVDTALVLTLDGQAGIRNLETESVLRSGIAGTRDRTSQQGPSFELSGGFTNSRPTNPPVVTFRVDASADVFRQETVQRSEDLAADYTTVTAARDSTFKSTNSNRSATVLMGWNPLSSLDVNVQLDRRLSTQVRPQPRQAALENAEGDDRTATVTARWHPSSTTDVTLRLNTSDSDRSSNLTTSSNRTQTASGYKLEAKHELWGTALKGSVEQKSDETNYRPIASGSSLIDQSGDFIRSGLRAERDIGKKITLNFTFDISLDQSFFDDGILDVDRQNRTTDLAITYKPVTTFTGRLSVTEDRQRTVNLHPSRAGNTGTQQRITVGAGYTYTVYDIRFAQTLAINAQSRTFDYNDADQSDLTRNNRLTTDVGFDVTPHAAIALEHIYNFRNSGRYALDDRGIRLFTLNREYAEQQVDVGVSYTPMTWLTFSGDQSLRVVVNRSPGQEGTRTPQYELTLFGQFKKTLMDAVNADLKVTRVLSTREDYYWRVDMTASRTF